MGFFDFLKKGPAQPAAPAFPMTLAADAKGTVVPMEQIPDEVFAQGILGKCCGIDPSEVKADEPEEKTETGEELAATGRLDVMLDKRNRNGKKVTLIVGFDGSDEAVKALAKELKLHCGVGGSALIINTLTDNKNRTAADVRSTLTKNGGSLGTAGSSSYLFQRKGIISIQTDEFDKVFEVAGDAGAEDVIEDDGYVEVITDPADFEAVNTALTQAGFVAEEAEVKQEPITRVTPDAEGTAKALKLIEKLEDLDDVQAVFSNLEIPDDYEGEV